MITVEEISSFYPYRVLFLSVFMNGFMLEFLKRQALAVTKVKLSSSKCDNFYFANIFLWGFVKRSTDVKKSAFHTILPYRRNVYSLEATSELELGDS